MPKLRRPAEEAQNRAIIAKIKYGMEMTGTTVEGLALSMRTSPATVYARLKCPGTFRLQELRAVAKGGMSGSILIGGLPFASDLFPITAGGVHGAVSGTSAVPITASVDAASNVISLWKSGGSLILTDTDITDNFAFWSFAFDYYAV